MNFNPHSMILIAVLFWTLCGMTMTTTARQADPAPHDASSLRLVKTIAMSQVEGPLAHMALDTRRNRLLLAVPNRSTVEVFDLEAGKIVERIEQLSRPQDVLYLDEQDFIVVSCPGDGTCRFFNADTLKMVRTVEQKPDAGSLRYESSTKRIYLGYGTGGIAILDAKSGAPLGSIKLSGHPEGFQLERDGNRIFVNIPTSGVVAVVDRSKNEVIATWSLDQSMENYPMALDEATHRLFVACRAPARLLVLDTDSGKTIAAHPIMGDCDDLFFDSFTKRVFISCGDGTIDVYQQTGGGPDSYRLAERIPTGVGARTSLLALPQRQFFGPMPRVKHQETELRVYEVTGAPPMPGPTSKPATPATPASSPNKISFDFDQDAAGALPPGWMAQATKPADPLATWEIIKDPTAPSGGNVLALTASRHGSGDTFNLCWTNRVQFKNGEIQLAYKPLRGEEDQGGGPIWRVKDANNYYICRANPLENNFRVYFVKDGSRTMLASATADAPAGQWHTIKIKHDGDHITCWLNGRQLLDVHDATFPDAGGVGVWTKADAVTSFDNIVVQQADK